MGEDRGEPGAAPEVAEFWRRYADAFVLPLRGNALLGAFIRNPAVTGAYAEAWVKSLVESMAGQLHIATGAIIRPSDVTAGRNLRRLPQSDLILWDPRSMPPLFQTGGFALVHTQAARAIIEIKRTISSVADLEKQLAAPRRRLLREYRPNVLGVVVSNRRPLHQGRVGRSWIARRTLEDPPPTVRLLDARGRADAEGILGLIYFLRHVVVAPGGGAV